MKDIALILIDIQNDYFTGGANQLMNSEAAAKKAQSVLALFRQKQLPVFHIQHINGPGSTFFLPSTKGAEIYHEVMPLQSESLIVKHYPNSFRETTLLTELRAMSISQLVICGMMTHMCVDATVRAARDYGFKIELIADACATKDLRLLGKVVKAEDVHYAFLGALNGFYATVMNTAEFVLK